MSDNLLTPPDLQPTALQLLNDLRTNLTTVIYKPGRLEVAFPCFLQQEMSATCRKIRGVFEDSNEISWSELFIEPIINIPTNLLNSLDEKTATKLRTIIFEASQKSTTAKDFAVLLKQITGSAVTRDYYDPSLENYTPTYTISYVVNGGLDPIKHMHLALNSCFEVELFECFYPKKSKIYQLRIQEASMRIFATHPRRLDALPIFHNPRAESVKFCNRSFAGKFWRFIDDLSHPGGRLEPENNNKVAKHEFRGDPPPVTHGFSRRD